MKIKKNKKLLSRDKLRDINELALKAHESSRGKIEIIGRVPILTLQDLAMYYTPGVGAVSLAIRDNKDLSYKYTSRGNRIAILTNGSRVLGLGGLGPEAGMPVYEGKSLLFKKFGNVDAVPLTVNAPTTEELVAIAKAIEPAFGGINMEDISPPVCFEVFDRLQRELGIPVFHDDRQGTSVVAHAALQNALKLVEKDFKHVKIVINGIGAAGVGIAQLFLADGAENVTMCDTRGILYRGRLDNMSSVKETLSEHTNRAGLKGQLEDAAKGADVLIGASTKGAFNERMIKSMNPRPIVFALANPEPEIDYAIARAAGAEIVATGASDVPNQVNNILTFPGIFRGTLDCHARKINTAMLLAASAALSSSIPKSKLTADHIIPNFESDDIELMTSNMAAAVTKAAEETGVARIKPDPEQIKKNVKTALKRYEKIEKTVMKLNRGMFLKKLFKRG